MKKVLVTFKEQDVRRRAEQYFFKYSGLDISKEKHECMYKEAIIVREKGLKGINLSALVAFFGPGAYRNNKIIFEKNEIKCEAFGQISGTNVLGIYFYLITAGECACGSEEAITDRLYADIWGTAYVDAGRDFLEDTIKNDVEKRMKKRGHLSIPISPGFFGMETGESKTINAILSGEEIGISVKDSGVMLPLKSCSGLYFVVRDPTEMPSPECRDCIGNPGGCRLCKVSSKGKGKKNGCGDFNEKKNN